MYNLGAFADFLGFFKRGQVLFTFACSSLGLLNSFRHTRHPQRLGLFALATILNNPYYYDDLSITNKLIRGFGEKNNLPFVRIG